MAETRQLSVRLSDEVFDGLEKMRCEGISLAEVARKIITTVVLQPEKLPSLQGGGPASTMIATVDLSPVLAAIGAAEERLSETQRETQRAVHEHGHWLRLRTLPKGDEVMRQQAEDLGEQRVREWERSVGR